VQITNNLELRWDARKLLEAAHYRCARVVSVDHDSILFLGPLGKPHTAWLHRQKSGQMLVKMVDGFSADVPVGLHDEALVKV
jgi:hypothetical protein